MGYQFVTDNRAKQGSKAWLAWRGAGLGAPFDQCRTTRRGAVEDAQGVAGCDEVVGHQAAHGACADESEGVGHGGGC